MKKFYRCFCLLRDNGEEWFIRRELKNAGEVSPSSIDHCGFTFKSTNEKTNGGYRVYRQVTAA